MRARRSKIAQLDQQHVWHPFTQMRDWMRTEPIVIVRGQGAVLQDELGREYLDANASIWTNLHGHRHPAIDAAIRRQLGKISHSSALGLANEPAPLLARELVLAASPARRKAELTKVFFSDDGSTAVETALKLAYEFARRTGQSERPRFLSLQGAYHGDTVGAVSLGQIDLFHHSYRGLLFRTDRVMAPYCYRCPFNRAKPERADAREYRRCHWECVDMVERRFAAQRKRPYSAFIVEPLMQGAAGMIPHPAGWLRRIAAITKGNGAQLVVDEVMTGFGRTGLRAENREEVRHSRRRLPPVFACQHEDVQPDFLAVAKGLTGGYLPMAATLTTQRVFDSFLGEYAERRTFFHGHSYTGNQLGAAAALASLKVLGSRRSTENRAQIERTLRERLSELWALPQVGDIRQVGLMAGVELVRDWRRREAFDWREEAGGRVCREMARRGVLTRPIGNVVVIMPPYCSTPAQVARMVNALAESIAATKL